MKNLSPVQTLVIGLVLYLLSRIFNIGGVMFELGGIIVSVFGVVMIVKGKLKRG